MFRREWGGPWGPRQHFFERGDLKYVILDLLRERPSHGYEIMRALEERWGGFYSPSPGAVYPTLELLADLGHVTVAEQDGRKIYTITDAGRGFLAERQSVVDEIHGRLRDWWSPASRDELREMKREMKDFAHLFDGQRRARWTDPERLRRIRQVVAQARRDVEAILAEERGGGERHEA